MSAAVVAPASDAASSLFFRNAPVQLEAQFRSIVDLSKTMRTLMTTLYPSHSSALTPVSPACNEDASSIVSIGDQIARRAKARITPTFMLEKVITPILRGHDFDIKCLLEVIGTPITRLQNSEHCHAPGWERQENGTNVPLVGDDARRLVTPLGPIVMTSGFETPSISGPAGHQSTTLSLGPRTLPRAETPCPTHLDGLSQAQMNFGLSSRSAHRVGSNRHSRSIRRRSRSTTSTRIVDDRSGDDSEGISQSEQEYTPEEVDKEEDGEDEEDEEDEEEEEHAGANGRLTGMEQKAKDSARVANADSRYRHRQYAKLLKTLMAFHTDKSRQQALRRLLIVQDRLSGTQGSNIEEDWEENASDHDGESRTSARRLLEGYREELDKAVAKYQELESQKRKPGPKRKARSSRHARNSRRTKARGGHASLECPLEASGSPNASSASNVPTAANTKKSRAAHCVRKTVNMPIVEIPSRRNASSSASASSRTTALVCPASSSSGCDNNGSSSRPGLDHLQKTRKIGMGPPPLLQASISSQSSGSNEGLTDIEEETASVSDTPRSTNSATTAVNTHPSVTSNNIRSALEEEAEPRSSSSSSSNRSIRAGPEAQIRHPRTGSNPGKFPQDAGISRYGQVEPQSRIRHQHGSVMRAGNDMKAAGKGNDDAPTIPHGELWSAKARHQDALAGSSDSSASARSMQSINRSTGLAAQPPQEYTQPARRRLLSSIDSASLAPQRITSTPSRDPRLAYPAQSPVGDGPDSFSPAGEREESQSLGARGLEKPTTRPPSTIIVQIPPRAKQIAYEQGANRPNTKSAFRVLCDSQHSQRGPSPSGAVADPRKACQHSSIDVHSVTRVPKRKSPALEYENRVGYIRSDSACEGADSANRARGTATIATQSLARQAASMVMSKKLKLASEHGLPISGQIGPQSKGNAIQSTVLSTRNNDVSNATAWYVTIGRSLSASQTTGMGVGSRTGTGSFEGSRKVFTSVRDRVALFEKTVNINHSSRQ